MRRKQDNSYFHFTKKERNGIIVLLCIILAIVFLPVFKNKFFPGSTIFTNKYADEVAQLKKLEADSAKRTFHSFTKEYDHPAGFKEAKTFGFFYFDPNTISADGWKRLGIKDKTIATIQNYLSKGGRFREATDIKKIWGLQYIAEKLLPFVRIAEVDEPAAPVKVYEKREYLKKEYQPVDINNADTAMLSRLPGIGAKLSQRIISYREKLGGFYAAEQVAETFGLADSTYKKILPSLHIGDKPLKRININTVSLDELKAHPYIRYHLANAIVQYRTQHGNYRSVEDISHIMLVNDSIYKRISPYLLVE